MIGSIARGCKEAGCALIGGETAEMPGLYAQGDYDLAGFAVGAVERSALLPRKDIEIGDVILALPSSGVHANGFSSVRRVVEQSGLRLSDPAPFARRKSLGAALLTPTRIYVRQILEAIRGTGAVKALAHITGGGLTENIPRVLPKTLAAEIGLGSFALPACLRVAATRGAARSSRDAAHLQLRHRHDPGGGASGCQARAPLSR